MDWLMDDTIHTSIMRHWWVRNHILFLLTTVCVFSREYRPTRLDSQPFPSTLLRDSAATLSWFPLWSPLPEYYDDDELCFTTTNGPILSRIHPTTRYPRMNSNLLRWYYPYTRRSRSFVWNTTDGGLLETNTIITFKGR